MACGDSLSPDFHDDPGAAWCSHICPGGALASVMRSRRREEQGLEDRIIAAASLVARGEWTTYGDISAAVAGSKRAARASPGPRRKTRASPTLTASCGTTAQSLARPGRGTTNA
jgi:hypothetical protein